MKLRKIIGTIFPCSEKNGETDSHERQPSETVEKWRVRINDLLRIEAYLNNPEEVYSLIERGANPNDRDPVLGSTALIEAARCYKFDRANILDTLRVLLNAKADPNAQDPIGWTPLMYIMETGMAPGGQGKVSQEVSLMLRVLVEAGIDFKIKNNDGVTAHQLAINAGNINMVEKLLATSLDVPLRKAISDGEKDQIDRYLKNPSLDVNLQDEFGKTLLMTAFYGSLKELDKEKIINTILAKKPNPYIRNNDGWTVLEMMAPYKKSKRILEEAKRDWDEEGRQSISDCLPTTATENPPGTYGEDLQKKSNGASSVPSPNEYQEPKEGAKLSLLPRIPE